MVIGLQLLMLVRSLFGLGIRIVLLLLYLSGMVLKKNHVLNTRARVLESIEARSAFLTPSGPGEEPLSFFKATATSLGSMGFQILSLELGYSSLMLSSSSSL